MMPWNGLQSSRGLSLAIAVVHCFLIPAVLSSSCPVWNSTQDIIVPSGTTLVLAPNCAYTNISFVLYCGSPSTVLLSNFTLTGGHVLVAGWNNGSTLGNISDVAIVIYNSVIAADRGPAVGVVVGYGYTYVYPEPNTTTSNTTTNNTSCNSTSSYNSSLATNSSNSTCDNTTSSDPITFAPTLPPAPVPFFVSSNVSLVAYNSILTTYSETHAVALGFGLDPAAYGSIINFMNISITAVNATLSATAAGVNPSAAAAGFSFGYQAVLFSGLYMSGLTISVSWSTLSASVACTNASNFGSPTAAAVGIATTAFAGPFTVSQAEFTVVFSSVRTATSISDQCTGSAAAASVGISIVQLLGYALRLTDFKMMVTRSAAVSTVVSQPNVTGGSHVSSSVGVTSGYLTAPSRLTNVQIVAVHSNASSNATYAYGDSSGYVVIQVASATCGISFAQADYLVVYFSVTLAALWTTASSVASVATEGRSISAVSAVGGVALVNGRMGSRLYSCYYYVAGNATSRALVTGGPGRASSAIAAHVQAGRSSWRRHELPTTTMTSSNFVLAGGMAYSEATVLITSGNVSWAKARSAVAAVVAPLLQVHSLNTVVSAATATACASASYVTTRSGATGQVDIARIDNTTHVQRPLVFCYTVVQPNVTWNSVPGFLQKWLGPFTSTASPSVTPSRSVLPSASFSQTKSQTITSTAARTRSISSSNARSTTASWSLHATHTRHTPTLSGTAKRTMSVASPTVSVTATSRLTASITVTTSRSLSHATRSGTSARSKSTSGSVTGSSTVRVSATRSGSPSRTAFTVTVSSTVKRTRSFSSSRTVTQSRIMSLSRGTRSATSERSRSASGSVSTSSSVRVSASRSTTLSRSLMSVTVSATSRRTRSISTSQGHTASIKPSKSSLSLSFSVRRTGTASASVRRSVSITVTLTRPSPSLTVSRHHQKTPTTGSASTSVSATGARSTTATQSSLRSATASITKSSTATRWSSSPSSTVGRTPTVTRTSRNTVTASGTMSRSVSQRVIHVPSNSSTFPTATTSATSGRTLSPSASPRRSSTLTASWSFSATSRRTSTATSTLSTASLSESRSPQLSRSNDNVSRTVNDSTPSDSISVSFSRRTRTRTVLRRTSTVNTTDTTSSTLGHSSNSTSLSPSSTPSIVKRRAPRTLTRRVPPPSPPPSAAPPIHFKTQTKAVSVSLSAPLASTTETVSFTASIIKTQPMPVIVIVPSIPQGISSQAASTNQVVVATVASGATALSSPADAMQASRALSIVALSQCKFDYDSPVDFPLSVWPGFGVEVGTRGAYLRGAVAAALSTVAAAGMLGSIIAITVSFATKNDLLRSASFFNFPGILTIPVGITLDGLVTCAVAALLHGEARLLDTTLAGVALVYLILVTVALVIDNHKVPHIAAKFEHRVFAQSERKSDFDTYMRGAKHWIPRKNGTAYFFGRKVAPQTLHKSFGSVYGKYIMKRRWFYVVDTWLTVAVSAAKGTMPTTLDGCFIATGVVMALCLFTAGLAIFFPPYVSPAKNCLLIASTCMTFVASVFVFIAMKQDDSSLLQGGQGLALLAGYLSVGNVVIALYGEYSRRRLKRLRRTVEEPELAESVQLMPATSTPSTTPPIVSPVIRSVEPTFDSDSLQASLQQNWESVLAPSTPGPIPVVVSPRLPPPPPPMLQREITVDESSGTTTHGLTFMLGTRPAVIMRSDAEGQALFEELEGVLRNRSRNASAVASRNASAMPSRVPSGDRLAELGFIPLSDLEALGRTPFRPPPPQQQQQLHVGSPPRGVPVSAADLDLL